MHNAIRQNVRAALIEDIGDGDVTAGLIDTKSTLNTRVIARGKATIAGQAWFDEVFAQLDPGVEIRWLVSDGEQVAAGAVLCELDGPARSILTGERAALNFLQTLSGTASRVRQYVEAVTGTSAQLIDTRKTLPGLRTAQKYAVRCGGGSNHRMGLYDALMLKENHIRAAGDIASAVSLARSLHPDLPIIVEAETQTQLAEACAVGADRVLLDNFKLPDLSTAVAHYGNQISLEASGNVNLDNVRSIALTGVHFISIGDMTKSVEAIDLSMRYH